jgi:hypothetical protein
MTEQTSMLSRRNVVLAGAAALGAVGAIAARPTVSGSLFKKGAAGPAPLPSPGRRVPPPLGAMSNWNAAVGSDFFMRTPSGSILAKLTAVAGFPQQGARPRELARQEAFVLFFDTGRVQAPQGEGIYTVTHRTMGEMQIFLSASTVSATGLTAVFN